MIAFTWLHRHTYIERLDEAEGHAVDQIDPTPPANPRVARLKQDWSRKANRDCRSPNRFTITKPKRKDRFATRLDKEFML